MFQYGLEMTLKTVKNTKIAEVSFKQLTLTGPWAYIWEGL